MEWGTSGVRRAQLWGFRRERATAAVGGEGGERLEWRCSLGATRFSDLRIGVSLKIGAAVAW